MADYSYVLFDTVSIGTTLVDALLFQTAQGGDATHTEVFTNMRGAGSLPASEKFVLERIGLVLPQSIITADMQAFFNQSILQFRLLNQILLWIPTEAAVAFSGISAFWTLAAAATSYGVGYRGVGYELKSPITINGGEKFDVRIKNSTVLSAPYNFEVLLIGTLSF